MVFEKEELRFRIGKNCTSCVSVCVRERDRVCVCVFMMKKKKIKWREIEREIIEYGKG